ncbi:patatin-like phospholipase family protein [Rhizobium sp. FKY42]|uniref:patatin-like phospholipase family protein n=1 Tax=Rhizobium sp. FKY42 TaxID=2562310 RepID=UPI001FEDB6CA|nr:patatin-like phospholipase family protein [Rhizobium sp. FKY42]
MVSTNEEHTAEARLGETSLTYSQSDSFASVWDLEHERIRDRSPRREAFDNLAAETEIKKAGLCLSGGGIRSAAVSLGVVQALQALKAFPQLDFLSTVSGGGYLGGAVIAGLYRTNGTYSLDSSQAGGAMAPADIADNEEVLRIRDRSRYLMPNGPLDLVVSFAIILRGLAVNAVIVAACVFAGAALTLFLYPTEDLLAHSWLFNIAAANQWKASGWFVFDGTLPLTTIALACFVLWLVVWAAWRSIISSIPGKYAELQDPASQTAKKSAIACIALAALFLFELQVPILRLALQFRDLSWKGFLSVVAPLTAGTGAFALLWKRLELLIQAAAKENSGKAVVSRILNSALLVALGLALPLLIYAFYLAVTVFGIQRNEAPGQLAEVLPTLGITNLMVALVLVPVAIIIAIVLWSRIVGPLGLTLLNRHEVIDMPTKRKRRLMLWVIAAVWTFLFFLGAILANVIGPSLNLWGVAMLYLGICATLTLIAGLFTENANSLHRLYRDRLAEAFRISDDGKPITFTDLASADDRGLSRRPYPIINAAVNMQGSQRLGRRRKADFFTFTPDYIGSEATGYLPTNIYRDAEPDIDLATAIAISGAAVSSAMGQVGKALFAPTLSLLNLRLGYWVRNPNRVKTREDLHRARLEDWRFSYLPAEIFGRLSEKHGKVLLSDGGHIDNLGLYQLLKRRCDFIIVSDAEADPTMNFSSLISVERYARIDLGVRLELPFEAIAGAALIRAQDKASSKTQSAGAPDWQHAAIGTIKYPEVLRAGGERLPEKTGVLLYIKACVTGDERSYVLDYERRFPRFPHESTGDQFFTEEQFEAYRALGFHATQSALEQTDGTQRWVSLLTDLRRHLKVIQSK